ncbi:hypothetical protein FRC12_012900 [Ceratobasidium sp. 428]|nr:hypothetical protein FRC12_012900 [Ceratobasidium sp. 428]
MSLLEQARHRRDQLQQDHRAPLPPLHPPLPSIHTFAPLPAPVARPAAFAVAHRTQDGQQAYDYGDLHETSSGGGYSYYSSSQTPAPRDPMFRPRPSFPITIAPAQPHAPPRPLPPPSRKFVHPPATYVPPAHPHSHHLHSIPPRDKSTRTLILDHLLWMHARARFGAARGELGVGTRPHLDAKDACLETLEDHGVMGLGLFEEGLDKLSYSSRAQPPPLEVDPDALTLGPPDLALAAAYRAKATGLEKVLTAMLDQTPQPEPSPEAEDDMIIDGGLSTSPSSSRSVIPSASQKLPNSVRLRLALSLLVNELFSPEPEPATPAQSTSTSPALLSLSQLASPPPPSLCPPSPPVTTLPSFHQLTSGPPPHPQSIFQTIPRGQGLEGPWTYPRTGAPGPSNFSSSAFRDGVVDDPYTQPQVGRCARHLSRTCQVPACAYIPAPGASTSSTSRPAMILGVQPGRTSTIGAGLGRPGGPPLRLPRSAGAGMNMSTMRMSISPPGGSLGISGLGSGMDSVAGGRLTAIVSRFLRLSALVAIELGREARGEEDGFRGASGRSAFSPPPVKIPNAGPYLPASSGSSTEGSDDEAAPKNGQKKRTKVAGSFSTASGRPIAGSLRAGSRLKARASTSNFRPVSSNGRTTPTPAPPEPRPSSISDLSLHARPTREWYGLLCGLVTRACLEGYLMRGWRGTMGAEVLFRLGVRPEDGPSFNGSNGVDIISTGSRPSFNNGPGRTMSTTEERELAAYEAREKALAAMYDPDEMPTLAEAGRILFSRESGGEEEGEWEREVRDRLVEFTSVPHDAPGLGAHLESIADRYPAEPVERAALRFCESVAKWRGKPELETYKKQPPAAPGSSPGPSIPIDQLINIPLSATPKPPIERYFHLPVLTPSASTPTWRASDSTPTNSKRPRAADETSTGDREAKKVNVALGPGYVEEEEWVGPYGL